MKKNIYLSIIAIISVIITALNSSLTAEAVSRTTTTEVLGVTRTVEDSINPQVLGARRNNLLNDNVKIYAITDKALLAQLSDLELFAKLISEYTHTVVKVSDITLLDSMDVEVDANTEVSEAKPVFLTFGYPSLLASTEAYVFHYDKNGWKIVPTTVAEGYVSGEFSSLSPVAIVAKTATLQGAVKGAARKKSPRTGDSSYSIIACCLFALGIVGFMSKKSILS